MGIRQQKRPFAPQPEVRETDYGAKFVNAVTETKDEPEVVKLEEQVKKEDEQVVETEPVEEVKNEEQPVEKPKKKGGRPKKSK